MGLWVYICSGAVRMLEAIQCGTNPTAANIAANIMLLSARPSCQPLWPVCKSVKQNRAFPPVVCLLQHHTQEERNQLRAAC
jgi:hypothetical protein